MWVAQDPCAAALQEAVCTSQLVAASVRCYWSQAQDCGPLPVLYCHTHGTPWRTVAHTLHNAETAARWRW